MKKLLTTLWAAPALAAPLLLAIGCEAPELPQAAQAPPPAAEPAPEPKVEMVAGTTGEAMPEDETPVTDIPRPFDSHDPIKGRRSRRAGGYLGAVAGAKFYAEHQMMINTIKECLALYNAEHGDWPKTQDEFMKGVIEFNQIKLPEIPEDEEYCYLYDQAEQALQIRLKPGSPRSKVPAGTTPEDAIKMLAGGEQPAGEQPTADQPAEQPEAGRPAPPEEEPQSEEPSPDIRTRAEQIGKQQNTEAEKHGVAPGGLVPVGGLGEDEF